MIKNEEILAFLKKHVDDEIETIERRGRDSLDFRDVYISCLVDLVKNVHEAGFAEGYVAGYKEATPEK